MTRKVRIEDFAAIDEQVCIACEQGTAVRRMRIQEFEYGAGQDAVTLHAHVPVWSCGDCGLEYVDAEGEAAQHAAVCHHLGRLAPAEIKGIRIRAGLTQAAFAQAINAGVASVKRWERGSIIQNAGADAAILGFQREWRAAERPRPVFRTAFHQRTMAAAGVFRLRRPDMDMAA